MDKISNRLRLVRSQSMGVGMGVSNDKISMAVAAARRTVHSQQNHVHGDVPNNQTSNTGVHGSNPGNPINNAGRNASVILLDERRLEMVIQPRLYAGELLDLIASHCQLKEKEFFGLAFVDENGTYQWLQLDRKVLDHDLPRKPVTLTVHFLVKFFIESISHLSENRTVELFYLQARSLIFRGSLEVDSEIVLQLAALALQASFGDYVDDTQTRQLIKRSPILPASVLKEHPSLTYCEDLVIEHYKKPIRGQTRGQAVVNYMTIIESMPTYGVHYFEVYDKRQTPWWLGLSCRGIAQYSYQDRKVPVRVFQWKQLENLYFRDKKFSIEVHDAKRVVQTVSSFNLYEDALKLENNEEGGAGKEGQKDELVDAIADSTTQVSVSRRSFNPGSIHVYVWFGKTQSLTKCIWQSAISQHQFYLDRKQAKMRHVPQRTLKEIARDLTRSSASLSSRTSSMSNLSRSGSTHSLAISGSLSIGDGSGDPEQNEETRRARMEMLAALKARREALDSKLKEKNRILKELCIKEGELTGELPPEIPLAPGEPVPTIRRRVGTEFALSEKIDALLFKPEQSPEDEMLAKLELEHEIQSKITSAALKIASDNTAAKSVRKQRKTSYQQSQKKLREIEAKLDRLKHLQPKHKRKQPRPPGERRSSSPDAVILASSRSGSIQVSNFGHRHGDIQSQVPRRGLSVPDLDVSMRGSIQDGESQMSHDIEFQTSQDEVDASSKISLSTTSSIMSPRSCPSSPRKNNLDVVNIGQFCSKHSDSLSLEASPQRNLRIPSAGSSSSGYIPSSVYLRSSYRTKQYPTLSTVAPIATSTTRTLSVVGAGQAHADVGLPLSPLDMAALTGARDRSATLPSPYRNKYEVPNVQIDSPVGLYNCPQQRTSQAFSSMDDLDALATTSHHHPVHHLHPNHPPQPLNAVMSSPTTSCSPHRHSQQTSRTQQQSYINHHLLNHRHILSQAQAVISHADAACSAALISQQPSTTALPFKANSLERSSSSAAGAATRQKKFVATLSNAAANRELPALPVSASSTTSATVGSNKMVGESRSMEDLDALESLGVHGQSKMQYREIINENHASAHVNGPLTDGLSAARMSVTSCSGIPSSTHLHHLPNTEEYPKHHHPSSCNSVLTATTTSSSISHRVSVSSVASSSSSLHGQVGIPRGYAAMSAAAQVALEQPHKHHSHQQHTVHQHGHPHRDAGGPYPALSHRNSTLLPGQTYPEPSLAKPHHAMGTLQEVFYHREMRLAAAVAANLAPSKTTSDQNSNHQRASLASTSSSTSFRKDIAAPPPPPKQNVNLQKPSNFGATARTQGEIPPPLFPKQYHQVVEQRRRSGLDRPTATAVPPKPTPPAVVVTSELEQSPAIDRKSKPITLEKNITSTNSNTVIPISANSTTELPQSQTSSTSTLTNSSTAENSTSSVSSLDATLISNNPSVSDNANNNHGNPLHPPKYVPYRETTKPFEMSDFYKYSTKFRKTSASSLPRSDSSGGVDESSPRSSTASESSPPEIPLRPNALNPGPALGHTKRIQILGTDSGNAKVPIPPPPPPKSGLDIKRASTSSNSSGSTLAATIVSTNANDVNSLGDAFSSEMLDWYNTKSSSSSRHKGSSSIKPLNGNNNIQQKGSSTNKEGNSAKDSSNNNKPATLV